MKHNLPLLVLALWSLSLFSQISTQDNIVVDNSDTLRSVNGSLAGDMDGDGDLDIIYCSNSQVGWYENNLGAFNTHHIISNTLSNCRFLSVFDKDSDGDLDVFCTNGIYTVYFTNIDGQGNFGGEIIYSPERGRKISPADIDGDGDEDFFILEYNPYGSETYLSARRNADEFGDFNYVINLNNSLYSTSYFFPEDMDNDGDIDVVCTSTVDDEIFWYENYGNFTFGSKIILFGENGLRPTSIFVADVNSDGNKDIVTLSNDMLIWLQNDGDGSFSAPVSISSDLYPTPTVIDDPNKISVADLDGDGDEDIMASSYLKSAWYENMDGQGSFAPIKVISNCGERLNAYDIDGDGNKDVLSSFENEIVWYKNDGNANFELQPYLSVGVHVPSSTHLADIDGDNDLDVITSTSYDDKIVWSKNNVGSGEGFSSYIISTETIWASSAFASDIDGDGDLDIISSSIDDDKIAWYENTDGLGNFGPQQIISTNVESANKVYSFDLDGDLDMDILAVQKYSSRIVKFINTDGQGNFAPLQTVATSSSTISTDITDIDGDGDLDLLYGSQENYSWIRIYKNEGEQGLVFLSNIPTTASYLVAIKCIDIDSDGDMDVVYGSNFGYNNGNGNIRYSLNLDGLGNFGEYQLIGNLHYIYAIEGYDIDGDGDKDIIVASLNGLYWFENLNGQGNFGNVNTLSNWACHSISVGDINNDGIEDLIVTFYNENKVIWFENQSILSTSQIFDSPFSVYPNPTAGKLNISSSKEIASVKIFNHLGQLMSSFKDANNIDISRFPVGLYFVTVEDISGKSVTKKIIKN